jgi:hypothetical protein
LTRSLSFTIFPLYTVGTVENQTQALQGAVYAESD